MPEVLLKEVSRENWEEALRLSVRPDQQRFTPTVAVSLAKAYIRPEGLPNTPYAVYADGQMVGFLNTVCDLRTTDTYWINGVLIDHACQVAVPFVQGQLRNEHLTCTIETECGHCHQPMRIEIDSDLNDRVIEGGTDPLVYSPMLDIKALEPSIIDGF